MEIDREPDDPSEEEISRACAFIRASWSEEEAEQRREAASSVPDCEGE